MKWLTKFFKCKFKEKTSKDQIQMIKNLGIIDEYRYAIFTKPNQLLDAKLDPGLIIYCKDHILQKLNDSDQEYEFMLYKFCELNNLNKERVLESIHTDLDIDAYYKLKERI